MGLLNIELQTDHLDNIKDMGGKYLVYEWYIGSIDHNVRKIEIINPLNIKNNIILTFTADTLLDYIEVAVKEYLDRFSEMLKLMDYKFKKNDNKATLYLNKKGKDVKICSICQDGIEYGQDIAIHKCKNTFHKDCITTWINQGLYNKCPLCRSFGRKRKSKKSRKHK